VTNRKIEIRESTSWEDHLEANHREERKVNEEVALSDLEPRAEIKGGSLSDFHKVTDVTLKRGSGG
jgi:hypothetical protein